MNVFVSFLCFLLAAFFHQALYLLIPILSIYRLTTINNQVLKLTPAIRLYLSVFFVVSGLFLVQSIFEMEIRLFSIKGMARYTTYLLFAALAFSFSRNDLERVFQVIIMYFVITVPLGIYQVLEVGRYQNIFEHANHLAYVLTIVIYYLIIYKPFTGGLRKVFIGLLFVSLLLTFSSGGVLVILALVGYNVLISKRISLIRKFALFLASFIIAGSVFVFSEKAVEQLNSLQYLNWEFLQDRVANFRGGGYGSLIWRIIYWTKILFTFFAEPVWRILFGIGVDSLTVGNMPYSFMYKDPHNDFVKVLVEFGLIGFLLFLGIFRRIYLITQRNMNIVLLILIPMLFGNTIVNFPFNIAFILLLAHDYKRNIEQA